MSSQVPSLPCEIIDDIVDTLLSTRGIEIVQPSSLALVCQRFKHRVDLQHFGKIEFHTKRTSLSRLWTLARLLGPDVWPPHSTLPQYVKSCTLFLGASETSPRDAGFDPKKDDVIATILRTIFRGEGSESANRYSLSIITTDTFCPTPNMSGMPGLAFDTSFGPRVRSSLNDLCHNSSMTELRLSGVWNVPPSILSSRITHLQLFCVHFHVNEAVGGADVISSNPLGNLKKLSFRNTHVSSASFTEVIAKWKHECSLQLIYENLETWAWSNDDLKAISAFGGKVLDTLKINTTGFIYPVPNNNVDYNEFQDIQCLELNIGDWDIALRVPEGVLDNNESLTPETPAFFNISNMLPTTLPPLLRINITMFVDWCDDFEKYDVLDELYPTLYHSSLVDCLKNRATSSHNRVEILIDIYIWLHSDDLYEDEDEVQKECERYMYQLLANLTSIHNVALTIKVSVCP